MQPRQLIELNHPIQPGMKTYPGLPEPRMEIILNYKDSLQRYNHQATFQIANLHLCGNTGTYIDAPCHRYENGMDLASLPLNCFAHVPIIVVHISDQTERAINAAYFKDLNVKDKAVLIHTGWSKHWGKELYFHNHPFLTRDACELLIKNEAKLVGIDSLNIDDLEDLSRPAHTLLLYANIPICEHMTNLAALPKDNAFLHAAPIAWVGGATFPVRAYATCF